MEQIDRLPTDKLNLVKQHVDERYRVMLAEETPEEKIAAIRNALDEFREGLSAEELAEMIAAMNEEYIDPDDNHLFDWIDDLPEDER